MKHSSERIALGDFAKVISGYAFKSKEFQDDGIPIIKIKNIRVGDIDLNDVQFVKEKYLDLDEKYHVNSGDILISLTGSHLTQPNSVVGRVAKYSGPKALLNQRAGKITINESNKADINYLYYTLSSESYKRKLALFASGAASQANISPSQVESVELDLPDIKTQQKIASILSAFDDLIENNTRRIAILEETARLIYREWFVHYRYPGHENDRLVDSGTDLGEVPEGWDISKISNVVDTIGGGTPRRKKDEYWSDGTIEWYTPSDLTAENTMFIDNSGERINELGLKKSSAKIFPAQSVMMTSRATIGVISINTTKASTNQGFITCVPNDRLNKYQIYFWLKEIMPLIEQYASGATYKEINKTTFRKIETVVPALEISKRFYELVDPIGRQIQTLQRQTQKLKETRDLLLPKLISGKVEV